MFLKELDFSAELIKVKKGNNKLARYGLIGEEKVSYQLKLLESDVLCMYNIRLIYKEKKAQFDFLVIYNNEVLIIEVKNLLGNIIIQEDGSCIREIYKDRLIDKCSLENPFIQMENQRELLNDFLLNEGVKVNINCLLVMGNDKMIIENRSNYKNVIKYDSVKNYVKNRVGNRTLSSFEFHIADVILKNHKEYDYYVSKIINDKIFSQYVPDFQNENDYILFTKLTKIRKELAKQYKIPICNIFNNKEAELLVLKKPKSKEEFISVRGFKEKRFEMFGKDIIKIFQNN